jgi:hypothetical protein
MHRDEWGDTLAYSSRMLRDSSEVRSLNPPLRDLDDRYREFLSILTDANKVARRELKYNAALVTAG